MLRLGLKEFLRRCTKEFIIYLWSSTFPRKVELYLRAIVEGTKIAIPRERIFSRELCKINKYMLAFPKYTIIGRLNASQPAKVVYHRSLFDFFVKYFDTHLRNTLLLDETLHKTYMNPPFNLMFVESFRHKNVDNYLVGNVLPYLELLHYYGLNVSMFVEENPFGTIKNVLYFLLSIVVGYFFFFTNTLIESIQKTGTRDEPTDNVVFQFSCVLNVNEILSMLGRWLEPIVLQSPHGEAKYLLHIIFNLDGVMLAMKFYSRPPTRH